MYSKVFAFVCIQLAVFNAATSSCINRCPTETIIPANPCPNQVIFNPSPCNNPIYVNPITSIPNQVIVNPNPCQNQILFSQNPAIIETTYPAPLPSSTTTIIQDSSVANNLANALQLLVVSNLLSNTLPVPGQIDIAYSPAVEILPPCGCGSQAIEVIPSYSAPVEYTTSCAAPVAAPSPCGCGCGYGYNYVF